MFQAKMLGKLKIPIRGKKYFTVYGGPSAAANKMLLMDSYGNLSPLFFVKMAAEIKTFCDVSIPTKDFSVPDVNTLNAGLVHVITEMMTGRAVYVGCMAGRGRTGLFLAILAKAFGVENPIQYVRENYFDHAVETMEQEEFVYNFEPSYGVKLMVKRARFRAFWSFFRRNLTGPILEA